MAFAVAFALVGSPDPGWRTTVTDRLVVVTTIAPGGIAHREGVRVGDAFVVIDGRRPDAGNVRAIEAGQFTQADLMSVADASAYLDQEVVRGEIARVAVPGRTDLVAAEAVGLVLATLIGGLIVLATSGSDWRPPTVAACVLMAGAPLVLQPMLGSGDELQRFFASTLLTASAIPFAAAFLGPHGRERGWLARITFVAGFVAAGVGGIATFASEFDGRVLVVTPAAIGGAILVHALSREPATPWTSRRPIIGATALAVGPIGSWAAVLLGSVLLPQPLVAAGLVSGVAALAGVGTWTQVREARRSQLERDLVIDTMEAERARIAADIHDDALQELSLLAHRLDTGGHDEVAASLRGVAERLRVLCYDLRTPVLADLGTGPALEWLVGRLAAPEGHVILDHHAATRPPPAIELAFFRVAQEAIANAVEHGRPPVQIRYEAAESFASLRVRDAGPGIPAQILASPTSTGRLGLSNIHQRAERIAARLTISTLDSGTLVGLDWNGS